jgi:hypothetical protein
MLLLVLTAPKTPLPRRSRASWVHTSKRTNRLFEHAFNVTSFLRHRPSLLIIALRPNTILARRQNPLRIQCVLDRLIQFHLRIVVEIVRVGNLVHQGQMRAVLAPALFRRIIDQRPDQLVSAAFGVRVFAVEDQADDVVHFPHADDECANKVKSEFAAAAFCDGVLEIGVGPGDFGDGREEEVGLSW